MGLAAPISGLGVNVHTVPIPSPGTVFSYFNWVRFDDAAPTGLDTEAEWTTMLASVAAYRAAGFKIVYLLSASWGSDTVGHARDILIRVQPDVLELYNEPDLNGVSAATAAADAEKIAKFAAKHCRNVFILSPAISMIASGSNARTWLSDFITAGGLAWVHGVAVHPYPWGSRPSAMTAELAAIQAQIGDKPLVCTEVGPITKLVEDINGGQNTWTAARAAAWLEEMRAACGTIPLCIYDGPFSLNIDGYFISTMCSAAANSATQSVNNTTGMFPGMRLYFATANVIRTVVSVTNSTTVVLDSAVNTGKNEVVTSQNHDMALCDYDWGGSPPANKRPILTAWESHLATAGVTGVGASDVG